MKKKILISILFISLLFTFTACGSEKNKEDGGNNNNGDVQESNPTISDVKNTAYVKTIDAYVFSVRTAVNMGYYNTYNMDTLYLFPVGKGDFVLETGGESPYNKNWKYNFVGVTYDGASYNYYVLALDGSNIGIDFRSTNTVELDTVEKLEEIEVLKDLYNSSSDISYSKNEMNEDLKDIARIAKRDNIKMFA